MDDSHSDIRLNTLPLDDPETIRKTESGRPCVLLKPMRVPTISDACYVAAGSDHCLATTKNGKAFSWGFNISYQCGQSRTSSSHISSSNNEEEDDDIDEVKVATPLVTSALKGQYLVWAGAGGQFSALAAIST